MVQHHRYPCLGTMVPLFGALSDKIGRKPQLLTTCILFIILPYPLFRLLLSGAGFWTVLPVQITLNLPYALVGSTAAVDTLRTLPHALARLLGDCSSMP